METETIKRQTSSKAAVIASGIFVFLLTLSWASDLVGSLVASKNAEEEMNLLAEVRNNVDRGVRHGEFPSTVETMDGEVTVNYTFDEDLMKFIEKRLKRYRSDHSSVVVIDNNTGKILAATGHDRNTNRINYQNPFKAEHPAASLIKVITASSLIEETRIEPNSEFLYRGSGTTLYKYQLNNKVDRWTRRTDLRRAFAVSNNVVFAKAALNNLVPQQLFQTASSFGFNKSLLQEVSLENSIFHMPQNNYNLAELASGMNTETSISPVHAALIASVIANDGTLKYPSIISSLVAKDSNEVVLDYETAEDQVISEDTAASLQQMMELTVKRGTAKGSFKRMNRRVKENLSIGGKTGTLKGKDHHRRDWFTAYAKPKYDTEDKGISISVVNVNIDRWYVKSAYLTREIIEHYYRPKFANR